MKYRSFLFLLVPILFACSKDRQAKDNELPVITLTSPSDSQVFTAGQTVTISGAITDNVKLSEIHVHISDLSAGTLLVDIHRYPGVAAYTLNETFRPKAGIQYRVQVIAVDNSANEGRTTVEISSN